MSKGNQVIDGIKVTNQASLKQGDNPGLYNWFQCNQLGIKRRMRQKGVRVGEGDVITEAEDLGKQQHGKDSGIFLLAPKMQE